MSGSTPVKVGAAGTSVTVCTDLVTQQPLTPDSIVYSVDDATLASVDAVSGAWVAVAVGTANITSTATANGFTHSDTSTLVISTADTGDFSVALTLTPNQ